MDKTENLVNCPLKDYKFSYFPERKPESSILDIN